MNKTVALRVRMSEKEAELCRAAMERLGLTERSTFVRWALTNSATQVLNGQVQQRKEAAQQPAPAQQAARPAAKPAPKPAEPRPAPRVVSSARPPPPEVALGIPLYAGAKFQPADVVEGDDWT